MGWSDSSLVAEIWENISPYLKDSHSRVKVFYGIINAMEFRDFDALCECEDLIMPDVVKLIAIDTSIGTVEKKFTDLTGYSPDVEQLINIQEDIISYLRVN